MNKEPHVERSIRLVVAEDSYVIREFLTATLGSAPEVEIVAVCTNGKELKAAVSTWRPDVVLTDIRMPPSGADEGIRVAAQGSHTPTWVWWCSVRCGACLCSCPAREHGPTGVPFSSTGSAPDGSYFTKRAVEKHVNSIFSKLELPETQDVSRRVKATLTYLSEEGAEAAP